MLRGLPGALRLACLLCRPTLSAGALESAKETVRSGLDWHCFLQFVLAQRIFPLISRHCSETLSDVIPRGVRSRLRVYTVANGRRADAMADELVVILTLLEKAGIRAVPLKGPALIERIWGDCRLSACEDLDVLVRRDDAQRATEILAGRGYKPDNEYLHGFPPWKLGSDSLPLVRSHELSFPIRVDLQTAPVHDWIKRSATSNGFWEQLQRSEFRGAAVWLLPDEWTLLSLALHVLGHLFGMLRWVAELHGALGTCAEAWPEALKVANALGVQEQVILSQGVCETILDEELIEPETSDGLVWRLARIPFWKPRSWLAEHQLQLAVRDRFRAKLAYLLSGLFRPGPDDSALLTLPSRLTFLYYLIRPIRLTMRYLIALPFLAARKPIAARLFAPSNSDSDSSSGDRTMWFRQPEG